MKVVASEEIKLILVFISLRTSENRMDTDCTLTAENRNPDTKRGRMYSKPSQNDTLHIERKITSSF